jgi:hypothetical protein
MSVTSVAPPRAQSPHLHLQVFAAARAFLPDGRFLALPRVPPSLLAEGLRRAVLDFLVKNEVLSNELRARELAQKALAHARPVTLRAAQSQAVVRISRFFGGNHRGAIEALELANALQRRHPEFKQGDISTHSTPPATLREVPPSRPPVFPTGPVRSPTPAANGGSNSGSRRRSRSTRSESGRSPRSPITRRGESPVS